MIFGWKRIEALEAEVISRQYVISEFQRSITELQAKLSNAEVVMDTQRQTITAQRDELEKLKKDKKNIDQALRFIDDLQRMGGGIVSVNRVDANEIFLRGS